MPALPADLWEPIVEELNATQELSSRYDLIAFLASQKNWPPEIWNIMYFKWDSGKVSRNTILSTMRGQTAWPLEFWTRLLHFFVEWRAKPSQFDHRGQDFFPMLENRKNWPDFIMIMAPLFLDYDRREPNTIGTSRGMAKALASQNG